jgi:hypothetical protein
MPGCMLSLVLKALQHQLACVNQYQWFVACLAPRRGHSGICCPDMHWPQRWKLRSPLYFPSLQLRLRRQYEQSAQPSRGEEGTTPRLSVTSPGVTATEVTGEGPTAAVEGPAAAGGGPTDNRTPADWVPLSGAGGVVARAGDAVGAAGGRLAPPWWALGRWRPGRALPGSASMGVIRRDSPGKVG